MVEHSKERVFHGMASALDEHLRKTYGPPAADDNLPAIVAVGLLQLSLAYFARTGAPKSVVREFFDQVMGEDPADAKPRIIHPAIAQIQEFVKKG